jgi:PAS domain S-box-containing protein
MASRKPGKKKARRRQIRRRSSAPRPPAESELERFFALTLDLLCIADFDGYFRRVNPAWKTTLGYSLQELVARPYIDFVHPEDREATLAEARKLTSGTPVVTFENRYRCKDGSYKWLLWNSMPAPEQSLIYAAARDITERKQMESQLQSYAAEIADLYNNAPCGYHSLDPDGVFIRINDTELAWLGYGRDEIIGQKRFSDLVTPESRKTFEKNFPRFKERGWVRDIEFEMIRKDGTTLPVLLSATAVRDNAGRYLMSRSTVFDNTERRALERMKDQFISMVGHELRTPLTSIRGALDLLAAGQAGTLTEKGLRMLSIAGEDTDRLIRLVNEVIDIERLELGRVKMLLQECDAAQLIRQASEVMQPMAEKAKVRLEVSSQPATVQADPDRILQTLTNLLSNAIKFSAPGATVGVSATRRDNHVLFQVSDQGRGIPPENLESIFGRFQQVETADARVRGGAGLGLSISRKIVQQHGGRLWAESAPGRGSTFCFTLPVATEKTGAQP